MIRSPQTTCRGSGSRFLSLSLSFLLINRQHASLNHVVLTWLMVFYVYDAHDACTRRRRYSTARISFSYLSRGPARTHSYIIRRYTRPRFVPSSVLHTHVRASLFTAARGNRMRVRVTHTRCSVPRPRTRASRVAFSKGGGCEGDNCPGSGVSEGVNIISEARRNPFFSFLARAKWLMGQSHRENGKSSWRPFVRAVVGVVTVARLSLNRFQLFSYGSRAQKPRAVRVFVLRLISTVRCRASRPAASRVLNNVFARLCVIYVLVIVIDDSRSDGCTVEWGFGGERETLEERRRSTTRNAFSRHLRVRT